MKVGKSITYYWQHIKQSCPVSALLIKASLLEQTCLLTEHPRVSSRLASFTSGLGEAPPTPERS